jgi:hypothetical protein
MHFILVGHSFSILEWMATKLSNNMFKSRILFFKKKREKEINSQGF